MWQRIDESLWAHSDGQRHIVGGTRDHYDLTVNGVLFREVRGLAFAKTEGAWDGWERFAAKGYPRRLRPNSALQPNPPWADKIMFANWKQVATFAQKQKLPLPTPNLPPSRKIAWNEHGCGKWGCAYPTEDPTIVCKLTADMSEAEATVGIASLQKKPDMDGVVRYYGIMPLRGKHAAPDEKRPTNVSLIWREAADCGPSLPEQAEKMKGAQKTAADTSWQLLYNALVAADMGRQIHAQVRDLPAFVAQVNRLLPAARKEALEDQDDLLMLVGDAFDEHDRKLTYSEGPEGFAYCIAAFELIHTALIKVGVLKQVSETLLQLLRNGILLADVHDGNICELNRPNGRYWVITDPGQAVYIGQKTKYSSLVKTTSWVRRKDGKLVANRPGGGSGFRR
jgi:hypothetical protein